MVALLRDASFVRLEDGQEMVVGPQKHAERMLLLVAGQLQVFEVSPSSAHELTLSVVGDGAAVGATGLVPRWTRDLQLRAIEPSLVCSIRSEDLEALMRANPEVAIRLGRTLANQLQLVEDRWADMVEKGSQSAWQVCSTCWWRTWG
jgi:CRP-like cAMP-binding protein